MFMVRYLLTVSQTLGQEPAAAGRAIAAQDSAASSAVRAAVRWFDPPSRLKRWLPVVNVLAADVARRMRDAPQQASSAETHHGGNVCA